MPVSKVTALAGIAGVAASSLLGLTGSGAAVPATTDVDLGFAESGTVTDVLVDVGARVEEGEPLARIERAKQQDDVAVAEAALAAAQARLDDLLAGRTPAEVDQDAVALDRATAAFAEAETDRAATGADAELSARQRAAEVDQAEAALDDARDTADVNETGRELAADQAEATSAAAESALDDAEAAASAAGCGVDPDAEGCAPLLQEVEQAEAEATASAANLASALVQAEAGELADDQAIDRAEAALSAARLAARSGDLADEGRRRDADVAVLNAALERRSAEAAAAIAAEGPSVDAVADARAAVEQAEAGLAAARRSLARTTLRAPADGVVTAIRNDVGEVAGSGGGGEEGGSNAFLTLEVVVGS